MADTTEINAALKQAEDLMAAGRKELTRARDLLRRAAQQATSARTRGQINQRLWNCERAVAENWPYFSQSGQDAWLDRNLFKAKTGGVFAEIGGYDGVSGSNTLFFELRRGWTGLLAEPSPGLHAAAQTARRCPCLRVAAAAEEGEAEFLDVKAGFTQMGGLVASYDPKLRATVESDPRHRGEVIKVPTRPLAAILGELGTREIDYVSLDVEGGELDVLRAFPFEAFHITAWTIENNAGGAEIPTLMQAKGYRLAEAMGMDGVYLRTDA